MELRSSTTQPDIYLLADHLDAMLAAGEDLLGVRHGLAVVLAAPEIKTTRGRLIAQRLFVERVRTLEMAIAMRGLEARKRARALKRDDTHLSMMAGLFVAGTAALGDAVEDLGDPMRIDFQNGHESVAYLRRRGLIAPDCARLLEL